MNKVSIEDLARKKTNQNLTGKKYQLSAECYLAKKTDDVDAIPVVIPCGISGIPPKLNLDSIGKIYGNYRMIGILPKRTIFSLKKALIMYVHENVTLQFHIFEIELEYNNKTLICNAEHIADENSPSLFKKKYVEPFSNEKD
jgi:hypothetical protein